MQNVGSEQFDYGTFKAAFETDPRIKTMTHNFDKQGIVPKTSNLINDKKEKSNGENDVEKMAKSATDLGDKLT